MTGHLDPAVEAFVASVADERRRRDARLLLDLMGRATGQPAAMWGSGIVGFGSHHYVYESGREGDTMVVGFSPRKAATTIYLTQGFEGHEELLERLGPHSTGKACLYLKRIDEVVDLSVLEELVRRSYASTDSS
jgi:hypothetical protein